MAADLLPAYTPLMPSTRAALFSIAAPLLLLPHAAAALGADANGYIARYECRAGNPNCDIDIRGLTGRACDQTITASMPWSAIDWSNDTICMAPGDHTAKGLLTLKSNGSVSNRKVLRYARTDDADDDPWHQGTSNRAILRGLVLDGVDYWIVHRLSINGGGTSSHVGINILRDSVATNNIISRVLVENFEATMIVIGYQNGDNTIQNSVIRDVISSGNVAAENECVSIEGVAANNRIVNNEIYNCNKNIFMSSGFSPHPGLVIENNDLYTTTSRYSDCHGNYTPTGACSDTEGVAIYSKGGSTSSAFGRIIRNRAWGMRPGDCNLAQCGGGWAVSFSNPSDDSPLDGTDYWLVQNNIFWDMNLAFWNYYKGPDHNSIIGNLVYKMRGTQGPNSTDRGGVSYKYLSDSEIYLNTFVDVNPIILSWGDGANNDFRCNVFIGGESLVGGYGSNTDTDQNAFYGVNFTTTATPATNVVYPNIADAKMTDYCFSHKLRTGPERMCIPNARPTQNSPHLTGLSSLCGTF